MKLWLPYMFPFQLYIASDMKFVPKQIGSLRQNVIGVKIAQKLMNISSSGAMYNILALLLKDPIITLVYSMNLNLNVATSCIV